MVTTGGEAGLELSGVLLGVVGATIEEQLVAPFTVEDEGLTMTGSMGDDVVDVEEAVGSPAGLISC